MNTLYSSKVFEDSFTYTGQDLGANWSPDKTCFRLWAPTASRAFVNLYESGNPWEKDLIHQLPMKADVQGTWVVEVPGDLHGVYYTFTVSVNRHRAEACDPYAKAVGVNGQRAMVIDLRRTNPDGWAQDTHAHPGKRFTDCVIYELHMRDISVDPDSGILHKGKYLGLTEAGTTTVSGIPTGLDHIKALGITHVHLLPSYDFGSVDEADTQRAQFNWGYDPVNFNVPEGSYSTDPFHGEARISEMKQMIAALHRSGIGVILDVVYNHVYNAKAFCFNRLVPGYFSRENSNGSGCGNDTASERSMVRKYIKDSVRYWADEYHIDGFRFDLVGLIDAETIRQTMAHVQEAHPNCLFYGEGWDMPTNVTKPDTAMAIQYNADQVPGLAFFNDTIRDSLRGSVFDTKDKGYAAGNVGRKDTLVRCFMGAPDWASSPSQSVNFVSCHDNHTLFDRLSVCLPQASRKELVQRNNLAAAFSLLSQGIPFLQAGEEMLRSKTGKNGMILSNTYSAPDEVNALKWSNLNLSEYRTTLDYYKGLIAIRRKYPVFRHASAFEVQSSVSPLPCDNPLVMAFMLYGHNYRIMTVFNADIKAASIPLGKGNWQVLAENQSAGTDILRETNGDLTVSPLSAAVLIQQRSTR